MSTEERGHRWFAATYDLVTKAGEQRLLSKVRPQVMEGVRGHVVEIGVGTGANLPYYAEDTTIAGTEPDPHMLKRARKRAAELGRDGVELHQAPAERLPFADASFDHAVSSLVLCTVDDPPAALAELRRVLRPSGTLRFIEHVRNDDSAFWGTVQDVIAPAWRWFAAGCNPNRRTQRAIEEAGFDLEWIDFAQIGPGTPAIFGSARRAEDPAPDPTPLFALDTAHSPANAPLVKGAMLTRDVRRRLT